jgi:alkylation response protein AidB-like acyl-CoA dehydrogenase
MTEIDDDGLIAFAATASRVVASCAGLAPRAIATRLADDGLLGILAPEESGGLALGVAHALPALRAAGAGLLGFPLLETLLLGAALGDAPDGAALVAGQALGTIAWSGMATLTQGVLHGTVGRAPLAGHATLLLVATQDGAMLVRVGGAGVEIAAAAGLDVDAPEHEIILRGAAPVARIDAAALAALREDALLLWAAAIEGATECCLDLAVAHIGTREQFGRALVSFQVLRHALARQKLGLEHIRATVARSLMLSEAGAGEAHLARRAAFATATRFGAEAVESALQLHGGMGFTWDIPLHRHLRRIRAWQAQGAAHDLHRGLVADLLHANS